MERILEIELFGEQYRFKADTDDKHAEKAIEFLINKVNEVGDIMALPKNDVNRFAQLLLATLNICNEYFDLKDSHDHLLRSIKDRSSKIVSKIDTNFK